LNSSAEFSDRPPLLLSSNGNLAALIPDFHYIEGTYQRGDVLLMATDALAKWLLTQLEQQRTEWNMLLSLNDPRRFADFVEKQRLRNQMKIVDDDTTLVVIPL